MHKWISVEGVHKRVLVDSDNRIPPEAEIQHNISTVNRAGVARMVICSVIVSLTCKEFGITKTEAIGKGKKALAVRTRFAAAYVMRENRVSCKRIGEVLGKRDHSTIVHACSTATKLLDRSNRRYDAIFTDHVVSIRQSLKQLLEPDVQQ